MKLRHIELKDANAFVAAHHRHNKPVVGHRFSLAAYDGDRLCGVAIAGRPIARAYDQQNTLEVTRLCTDGTRNACSFLYGAVVRAAKALGYSEIITYTLATETGASLKAAGFVREAEVKWHSWNSKSRPREDGLMGDKVRWKVTIVER